MSVPVCPSIRASYIERREKYRRKGKSSLDGSQASRAAAQFRADWDQCLRIVEDRLFKTDPVSNSQAFAWYQGIVRVELNTWFQPEHRHGAWLRALSEVRPVVAATVRQRLTDVRLPTGEYMLVSPGWLTVLACSAAAFVSPACLYFLPLPVISRIGGGVLSSVLILGVAGATWRKKYKKQRLQLVREIRAALQEKGSGIAAMVAATD